MKRYRPYIPSNIDEIVPTFSEKKKELFWNKVNKTSSCWIWTAVKNPHGYGQFSLSNRHMVAAHRVSWVLANDKGIGPNYVLHKCDNPSCVNPDHLFLGNQFDNMQDMVKKGRANKPNGESNHASKLTWEKVFDIRFKWALGESSNSLGKQFNVSKQVILGIVNNRGWRHAPWFFRSIKFQPPTQKIIVN